MNIYIAFIGYDHCFGQRDNLMLAFAFRDTQFSIKKNPVSSIQHRVSSIYELAQTMINAQTACFIINLKEITAMSKKRLTPCQPCHAFFYAPLLLPSAPATCPLWPYRMGTNPARKGKGGDIRQNIANLPEIPVSTNDFGTN
jgi:hypothetical protein